MNITKFDYKYINFYKYLTQQLFQSMEFPETLRFGNTTILKIKNDIFLYGVRFDFSIGKKIIIPGNDKKCSNPINIGQNYWWNNWGSFDILSGTMFFVGNPKINLRLCELRSFSSGIEGFRFLSNPYFFENDYRLANINNENILYSSNLNNILKIEYDETQNIAIIEDLTRYWLPNKYISSKNMQIISIENNQIKFIDWFYTQGVRLVTFDIEIPKSDREEFIEYSGNLYVLDGNGSYDTNNDEDKVKYGFNYGIMPGLSVSTPLIQLDSNKFGKSFLGVGHIKIHSDENEFPYLSNSNIQKFRENLNKQMRDEFKDKYILHKGSNKPPNCKGFIYMLYFYILYNDCKDMLMSDSYLPIYLDRKDFDGPNDKDYKFSLVFPMGLTEQDNKLIVTCGEGDFYSMELEFDKNEAINLCKHNVKDLDMRQYNYYILGYKNKKPYVKETLNEIKKQNGGSKKYYNKYIKYKSKYIGLLKYIKN